MPIAEYLAERFPDIHFHFSYEVARDYHHLSFEYQGHTYDIQWYRVFSYYLDGGRFAAGTHPQHGWDYLARNIRNIITSIAHCK